MVRHSKALDVLFRVSPLGSRRAKCIVVGIRYCARTCPCLSCPTRTCRHTTTASSRHRLAPGLTSLAHAGLWRALGVGNGGVTERPGWQLRHGQVLALYRMPTTVHFARRPPSGLTRKGTSRAFERRIVGIRAFGSRSSTSRIVALSFQMHGGCSSSRRMMMMTMVVMMMM